MAKKAKVEKVEKIKEVKEIEVKYTEAQKKFIKDNNMDEYIRLFGKE